MGCYGRNHRREVYVLGQFDFSLETVQQCKDPVLVQLFVCISLLYLYRLRDYRQVVAYI
jgi:hypothetical protein